MTNHFIHSFVVIHGKDLAAFRQDVNSMFTGNWNGIFQERLEGTVKIINIFL